MKDKSPKFDLEERLMEYAGRVIHVTEAMFDTKAGNHISGQLLRSGTSPFGNHGEAEGAESVDDFIHKLRVCFKELRESRRWLRLVQRVPLIENPNRLTAVIDEAEELIRIFAASIRTVEKRRKGSSA